VVLGYNWWQQHFGGDRNLIGQKLTLNNQATTVVGIMPPEFEYRPAARCGPASTTRKRPTESWQDIHLGCGAIEARARG